MTKRLKLFASMVTCCFAFFALCFGVFASISVSYQISGNILYEIEDAYVDITTTMFSSSSLMDYEEGASIAQKFLAVDKNQINSTAMSNGLTFKGTSTLTSLGEQFNSSLSTNFQDIKYSKTEGYTYFLVVNIKNLSTEDVCAIMQDDLILPQNSWDFNSGYLRAFDNSATNKNIVIAFGLLDAGQATSTSFSFGIDISLGDLEPTTDKFYFNEYDDVVIKKEAKGVVVLPNRDGFSCYLFYDDVYNGCGITHLVASCEYEYITDDTSIAAYIPNLISVSANIDMSFWMYCPKFVYIDIQGFEDNYSFYDGCLYNKDKTQFIKCPQGKTNVDFYSATTTINNHAFTMCNNIYSIVLSQNITTIEEYAFWRCQRIVELYKLCNIDIPNTAWELGDFVINIYTDISQKSEIIDIDGFKLIKSIDDGVYYLFDYVGTSENLTLPVVDNVEHSIIEYAFGNYCEEKSFIKNITIPVEYNIISNGAFSSLKLTSITCLSNIPLQIERSSWGFWDTCESIYVPSESVDLYKSANGWSKYSSIIKAIV